MAKKKGKSRRQGAVSKILNIVGLALAFWPEIQHFIFRKPGRFEDYLGAMTGDISRGRRFNLKLALKAHSPRLAAGIFYGVKKLALRYFPVRK